MPNRMTHAALERVAAPQGASPHRLELDDVGFVTALLSEKVLARDWAVIERMPHEWVRA